MRRQIVTIGMAAVLSMASCMTAFAGWEQTGMQWKYQNAGTYYNDGWHWIDGNGDNIAECYYFNTDGIMLSNTTTPDQFVVNENGAWIVDGIVQTRVVSADSGTSDNGMIPDTDIPSTGNPTVDAALAESYRQQQAAYSGGGGENLVGADQGSASDQGKGLNWGSSSREVQAPPQNNGFVPGTSIPLTGNPEQDKVLIEYYEEQAKRVSGQVTGGDYSNTTIDQGAGLNWN